MKATMFDVVRDIKSNKCVPFIFNKSELIYSEVS